MRRRSKPFDLISLRWALRAAEHVSFRAAATSLGVEQAALSRRVRALEDEIGVSIFERRRTGVVVTNAGHEFLSRVNDGLAKIDHAARSALTAGQAKRGALTVSFYQSLSSGRLQDLLAAYRAKWSNVELRFVELGTNAQLMALRDREIDVGFLIADDAIIGVDSEFLWNEPAYLVTPETHPLAEKAEVRWGDLKDLPILARGRHNNGAEFMCMVVHMRATGYDPDINVHRVSREGLLGLVAAGYGVTIVSNSSCSVAYPGVVFRRIAEENASFPVRMAWIAENDNPVLRRFISHIRRGVRLPSGGNDAQFPSDRDGARGGRTALSDGD